MGKLYRKTLQTYLSPFQPRKMKSYQDVINSIPRESLNWLKSIPSMVFKCWGCTDIETRHFVLKVFQEQLLLNEETDSGKEVSSLRISSLLILFSILDETDKSFLDSILNYKSRINALVAQIIDLKHHRSLVSSNNKNGALIENESQSTINIHNLKQLLFRLVQLMGSSEKKTGFFDKLLTTR
jgi:hypothetical protein